MYSTQRAHHVRGQPLHDGVVGPVHGKVGGVDRKQRPRENVRGPTDGVSLGGGGEGRG